MDDLREMYTGSRNKEKAVSIIKDITATGTQEEVNAKYDKWAATYNEVILTLCLLIPNNSDLFNLLIKQIKSDHSWRSVGLMLGQRPRRWPSIGAMYLVFVPLHTSKFINSSLHTNVHVLFLLCSLDVLNFIFSSILNWIN